MSASIANTALLAYGASSCLLAVIPTQGMDHPGLRVSPLRKHGEMLCSGE